MKKLKKEDFTIVRIVKGSNDYSQIVSGNIDSDSGMIIVKHKETGLFGLVTKDLDIISDAIYDYIQGFVNGFAYCQDTKGYYKVDSNGGKTEVTKEVFFKEIINQ